MRSDDAPRRPSRDTWRARARSGSRILLLALAGLSLPALGSAQAPGRRGSPDFLIGPPHVTLTLRGGMLFPRADSRVFSMDISEMSLTKSDLNAPLLSGELGIWTPRADITVALAYARSRKLAEYKHWEDGQNLPIENSTRLAQVPFTVGMKAYLLPRGRQVGRYAYIPSRYQPYVGIAGGVVYHQFRQVGDFINFNTANYDVYSSSFESDGYSPTVQVLAGNEISLTRRTSLQVEARYGWASRDLGSAFPALAPPPTTGIASHERIDVSGLQATIGFGWRL